MLTLPHVSGKLRAADIEGLIADYRKDANSGHMVMPGMVYISHPTEYGRCIRSVNSRRSAAYAAKTAFRCSWTARGWPMPPPCPCNEVSLKDIARLCDVFYIGGTKCGPCLEKRL